MSELLYDFVIEAEAEVTPHPECPACGQTGCEVVHTAETEETQ